MSEFDVEEFIRLNSVITIPNQLVASISIAKDLEDVINDRGRGVSVKNAVEKIIKATSFLSEKNRIHIYSARKRGRKIEYILYVNNLLYFFYIYSVREKNKYKYKVLPFLINPQAIIEENSSDTISINYTEEDVREIYKALERMAKENEQPIESVELDKKGKSKKAI